MIFIIIIIVNMKVIVNRNQYEKVINEGRGYSKSVEKWGDYVTDELLPMILKQDVGEDTYSLKKLSLKLKERDFYKEIPIESILLTVIINDSEDDEASVDMNYNPYWTQIVENEDGSYNILDAEFDMILTIPKERETINYQTLHYYVSSFFSHEFMHLYEWVNRGLESPKELKGCEGTYQNGNIYGDAVDRIAYMLYVSLSFELNSFVQQAATMISKRSPENRQQFMTYLKELPMYKFAETMVEYDNNIYLEEINNLPKDRLVELNKIMLCYYYEEGKLPKFKPVDKFLSDIDKHFMVRGEGLKRKLLRLITVV
tara:strand:+ start:2334 stop:3275 length:942 start_codon:yes stop_codon:yes gene_type:complete